MSFRNNPGVLLLFVASGLCDSCALSGEITGNTSAAFFRTFDLQAATHQLRPVIHDVITEALLQFGFIGKSDGLWLVLRSRGGNRHIRWKTAHRAVATALSVIRFLPIQESTARLIVRSLAWKVMFHRGAISSNYVVECR